MDPLRIALLTSRRAPGLETLLTDPNRGSTWELTIVIGSELELEQQPVLDKLAIPVELRPMRLMPAFRNLRAREDFDDDLGDLIARLRIDYVLLDGWNYILTPAMTSRFPGKILAIHDADLSIRDRTLFAGSHAVRNAILAGEIETRTSVYVVTGEVARGPMFLLSQPYPVAHMALDARELGDIDFLYAYAELHRDWMRKTCWGEMLVRSLELLAAGTTQTIGDVVWVDGAPGPCRMGESPRQCHEPETLLARGIPRSCPFIE
jgi:folate-dependent phosphoribosylglycinamide formyltransferase PurN